MHVRLPVAALGAAAALSLTPAAASAATGKTVLMGLPPSAQKAFEKSFTDVDAFFPSSVTVHVGDPVTFAPVGFHNVDLPAKGGKPVGLIAPTGSKAAENDAAGQPFWFNGQPVLGFNHTLLASAFGKKLSYTGARAVNSGLPLANKPKPVVITFKKAGTYTYYCDVHPGMKGIVHVLAKAKRVPSAAADAKRVKKQVAKAVKTMNSLATTAPAGTLRVGASGAGGVERLAFVPDTLTVSPGTTVKFAMPPGSREDHTATTGPGDPGDEKQSGTYLGKLAASFNAPEIDPAATYPSEAPPSGVASLTPSLHGNGFWNSGVLDTTTATPLPADGSVKFSQPGTYQFYCLIHPFMHATVTVK